MPFVDKKRQLQPRNGNHTRETPTRLVSTPDPTQVGYGVQTKPDEAEKSCYAPGMGDIKISCVKISQYSIIS